MNLKAKPIVKNQYWVVTDGEKKVGNVVAEGNGYELKINGNSQYFTTTKAIEKNASIINVNQLQISVPFFNNRM